MVRHGGNQTAFSADASAELFSVTPLQSVILFQMAVQLLLCPVENAVQFVLVSMILFERSKT